MLTLAARATLGQSRSNDTAFSLTDSGLHFHPSPTNALNGDPWIAKAWMPTNRGGLAAASPGNGKLYALGGKNGGGAYALATCEEYDPNSDLWAEKAPMPTGRFYLAAAPGNGKLYAIGGQDNSGNYVATCEEYDPSTNTWTTKSPMPTARSGLATVAFGGMIYTIGGTTDGTHPLATCEVYDPSTDTWTTKSPMPTARFRLAAVASGGMIYVIGGTSDSIHPLATCEAYDPVSDSWTEKSSIPGPREGLAVADPGNGKIYALGGFPFYIETCEAYDPSTNTWSTTPAPMPTARKDLAAVAPGNGKLYAIGGENGGDTLDATEEYTPEASSSVPNENGPFPFSLSVSPNPAINSATIHATLPETAETQVELLDNSGHELYIEPLNILCAGSNDIVLSTAYLASGTYFVRLFNSKGNSAWARMVVER